MKRLSNLIYLLIIIFLLTNGWGDIYAQKSKVQLEKQKATLQKQVKEAQQILAQTANKKKASIGQLNAIKKQIEAHTKLIKTYSAEIKMLNSQISEDMVVISALQKDLENMKKEYADMVYSMYKSSSGFSRLAHIFASANLNQFYMRFKYLEQYTSARRNQVKLITEVKEQIENEKSSLEITKNEKSRLLQDQIREKEKLSKLKAEQYKVFAQLKKQESKLKMDIAQKKQEVSKLEKLIARLLKEEIRKTANNAARESNMAVDIKNVTSSFEKSKAQLPWPVTTGFISEKFGNHPHPVLKSVTMPNDGVNIQTKQNEKVRAVFDGIVKKIAIVPGEFKYVIIVQHGNYYTVYAKLRKVNVKMGQRVYKNDVLGEVNTDADGISEVQFQVWKKTQKLDTELWLAKR